MIYTVISKLSSIFKHFFITPVYRKGAKTDPGNYRPISLTSHLINVFERVIRKRLVAHLEEHDVLTETQHGFRKVKKLPNPAVTAL